MALANGRAMRCLFLVAMVTGAVAACARPESQLPLNIPFEYREGLIWLNVGAPGGSENLVFLLDSGAARSVFDTHTARRLGLRPTVPVKVRGVRAETDGFLTEAVAVRVGALRFKTGFLAVDLGRLSDACHRRIDGLLGADFFRGRILQIDFAAQQLRVLPATAASIASQVLPLRTRRGALCVQVRVNGHEARWARLDTGYAGALQWATGQIDLANSRRVVYIGLADVPVALTRATVRIGQESFDDVWIGLHEREIFPGEAGLLGNGLLSKFCVTIDGMNERVILEKR
ncbi:MAG: retropepsin-like domain-containing protein [Verrucomicrobia bacterium]|nr:retropepsin-like domain-containing protein [Verrucomicrobiota bacterium]